MEIPHILIPTRKSGKPVRIQAGNLDPGGSRERRRMKTTLRLVVALSVLLSATVAHAGLILDTGAIPFSPTGTQFGRITRDGDSSIWGVMKQFPGVTGAPTVRADEQFTIHNFDRQFLQISLDDPDAVLFDAAYMNVFTPVNVSPNFGLNVNYLGDPGLTQPLGNPSAFQIAVPLNSTIIVNINEVNPGGGTGHAFDLVVEGFYSADFSEVPEPGPLLMTGATLAWILFRKRWQKS
jgi:hypothetical protein